MASDMALEIMLAVLVMVGGYYHAWCEQRWARERRELLDRIQRPDELPSDREQPTSPVIRQAFGDAREWEIEQERLRGEG